VTGALTAPRLIALDNSIREYAWGSVDAIPRLLGIEPTGRPAAELWIGAHPDEPSVWSAHPDRPGLDEVIATDPERLLGDAGMTAFGPRLPFLLKVLAADKALSLQVHPTAEQARTGYESERAPDSGRDPTERNYSDPNHKPELAYALTDFQAFCGFRPAHRTAELFAALAVPELQPYCSLLTSDGGLRASFTTMLTLPDAARGRLVEAAIAGCRALALAGGEWAPAAQASVLAAEDFPGDVGAVLALLLNHVRLAPGEAIFLGAGNVHAYLRGVCIEVLANSDNVLRCGLTPKRIDIPELLRVADFTALAEPRWQPAEPVPGTRRFEVPVPDFALSVLDLDAGSASLIGTGPHLVLGTDGPVTVTCADERLSLGPWSSVFVAAGECHSTVTGSGTAYVVSTNLD